jgi:hypothetical protein
MNKKEISSRNNLYRRNFLSGIAAIAATTTPSLAGSAPVGAGQNLPQTAPVPTSRPNGRLRDKVAVVTGAARGISRATALAFAREAPTSSVSISVRRWTRVPVLNHRPKRTGRKPDDWYGWLAAAGWESNSTSATCLRCERLASEVNVNSVALTFCSPMPASRASIRCSRWRIQTGTANAVRAFAPYIVKRGGGRIILTSSTEERHGTKFGKL